MNQAERILVLLFFFVSFLAHCSHPKESGSGGSQYVNIPIVDLTDDTCRQIVVDREHGQYLGHPTTVLLEDNKTMICVYPKGHGRGAIVMKQSTDAGLTWSERLPTPGSWETSLEVPTLYRVMDPDGKILFEEDGRLYLNQIEAAIETYRRHGFRNNQIILQVGHPTDMLLVDPPCLRHIDTRIQDDGGGPELRFHIYFRY